MPRTTEPAGPAGERRRQAILDAAYHLFTSRGYRAVTLDEILAISGGSKASIYKYFGDKQGVLAAVTGALAEKMLDEIAVPTTAGTSVRTALRRMGLALGRLMLGETAIRQQRLAASNHSVDPELAWLWWERGPKTTLAGFAGFLRGQAEAGRLKLKDPTRAAQYFLGMIGFKDDLRMLAGGPPPSERELQALVDGAVDVFLAAYAPGRNQRPPPPRRARQSAG